MCVVRSHADGKDPNTVPGFRLVSPLTLDDGRTAWVTFVGFTGVICGIFLFLFLHPVLVAVVDTLLTVVILKPHCTTITPCCVVYRRLTHYTVGNYHINS